MAEPTAELIYRAQRGDPESLGALIVSQQQYIYNIAMTVMRQPEDAADLTQEACIKLLRVIGQYNGDSRFTTWLYRLVLNLGRDELRKRGRRVLDLPPMTDDDGDTVDPLASIADDSRWADPQEVASNHELRNEVARALHQLEDHYRLALTLYYFDDLRYNDIA
ncbi:MAG: sigma-70 family RNA polymerase sigma factor, partial [Herpetosiphon sp.]|nr:sigma-70 family RNA polymerase sigma factor [Herpetosiphon sp.]